MKNEKSSVLTIDDLFKRQKEFNDYFYTENLSPRDKEEITRSLSLALHNEVSALISGVNFKDHKINKRPVDLQKILYESVDAFRYILAILNLWNLSSDNFSEAFHDKDLFLHMEHQMNQRAWNGEPVVIVDLDDVIIEFREGFISWLENKYNLSINRESTEYYTTAEVKAIGLNPESVFQDFISQRELRNLAGNQSAIDVINQLSEMGVWIQLLTARPSKNLTCLYDTYRWLQSSGLKFNRLSFSPEKYLWLAKTEYYDSGKVLFAIDDSPKHIAEFAKHGIKVLAPRKSYNLEIENMDNVDMFENFKTILTKFNKIL